jgi:endoglucanase
VIRALAAGLLLAQAAPAPAPSASPAAPLYLRVNQVGFRPGDFKSALAMTDRDLGGQDFEVRTSWGQGRVFGGKVGADRGRYGRFAHVYELDFSPLSVKGRFVVRLGGVDSPVFAINDEAHAQLLAKSLVFFRVQRCGEENPARGHGACHTQDGVARGGPADGTAVRAGGGWHDAGDYIKFLITTGYATNLVLSTYLRHPDAFADDDANRIPDVLEEARVGLDWILKLWDGAKGVLYYQVSDAADHGTWRLPEQDKDPRPVWACEPGKGANVAGKAAATLAMAAVIWNDPAKAYYDADRVATYLEAAKQIYAYGKQRPGAQPSNPPEFYTERSFEDNMALAALALYRATGQASYLKEARELAQRAGGAGALSWSDSHALAHYEIARADRSYVPEAKRHLETTLEAARGFAAADPFRVGLAKLHWGSSPDMAGVALQAFWYRDLTGDGRYLALAQQQWDYLLGANPWGVCFVGGLGTMWPRFPHHQIADLAHLELTGFWDEGPVPLSVFTEQKIKLARPDAYETFQSDGAVYHDDKQDYVTNEPTLDANAAGLSLTAWYVASAPPSGAAR